MKDCNEEITRQCVLTISVVHSHWSRANKAQLSLSFCLLLTGSSWHKDTWLPWTLCHSEPARRGLRMRRAGSLWHKSPGGATP